MGFTRNYSDQSTDTGFQFEFYCDQCGTAHTSKLVNASSNFLPDVLDAASSMFGGVFNAASRMGDHARSAGWQKERDAAFAKACDEVSAKLSQCPGCSVWVDKACWDKKAGQCRECAQSEQEEAEYAEEDESELITCPACDAEVKKSKFCAECGKPLMRTCTCGALVTGGKFCPDCGKKLSGGGKKK